jgi:hypothetical protein
MVDRIDWEWYGTWVIDWLCCDRKEDWKAYYIWEKMYLAANPELVEAREESYIRGDGFGEGTTIDLIENHYNQSLLPMHESFVWKIFLILHRPMQCIYSLFWKIRSLLWRISILVN